MKTCPSCGADIAGEETRTCPKCGALLDDQAFLALETILKKKCAKDPEAPDPYLELADFYAKHQKLREAELELLQVLNLDENCTGIHERLARIYYEEGNDDAALQFLHKALREKPDDPEIMSLLAQLAVRLKLWDQAGDHAGHILAKDPDNTDMLAVRAAALRAKGDSWGLLETLEKLATLKKDDEGLMLEIARLHEALGNRDLAMVSWQHVLERDPEDKDAIRALGKIHFAREEYRKAIEYLKRANILSNPDLNAILLISYIRSGLVAQAESHIKSSYFGPEIFSERTRKSLGLAFFELGNALKAAGKFHNAAHYYQKSRTFQLGTDLEMEIEKAERDLHRRGLFRWIKGAVLSGTVLAAVLLCAYLVSAELTVVCGKGTTVEVRDHGALLCRSTEVDCRAGRLFLGPYRIVAQKPGYKDFEVEIWTVLGGEKTVIPVFTPIYASLEIKTRPTEAEIFLDGKPAGLTPVFIDKVLARPIELTLRKEGRISIIETIHPLEGKKLSIEKVLSRSVKFDFTSPPENLRFGGGMDVRDGKLAAAAADPSGDQAVREAYYDKRLFKDFLMSVKVKAVKSATSAPKPGANPWNFGLRFRQANAVLSEEEKAWRLPDGQRKGLHFYSTRNAYNQQGLTFGMFENEDWDVLKHFARDLDPAGWTKLSANCSGKFCTLFFNDKEMGKVESPITEAGLLGVFSYPGDYDVYFDDLEIVELPDPADHASDAD